MNRRQLLVASASTAIGLLGARRCGAAQPKLQPSAPATAGAQAGDQLAGRTLEQLRDRYRYDLFDDFLPFMDKHIIDHELGGFMCNADRDGTLLNTTKNAWFTGRGIWVYAFLYNELAPEPKYLEVARKAVGLLLRNAPTGDDLWAAEVTKQGEPIASKGLLIGGKYVDVSKEVYGDLFIAGGFAEFGRAAKEPAYWDRAKQMLLKCVRLYDRPDYAPSAPKVYLDKIMSDPPELPGARLLAVWMLLLHLGSQLLTQREDAEVRSVVDRSLDAIFAHHYNPEYDLLNEVLCHDMSRPEGVYRDLVYTGHGIETLWMVLYEARRRQDRELFEKAARLLHRTIEVSWDDVYGGLFRCLLNVDQNTWILDKAQWTQAEALIGTLCVVEEMDAEWARHWFSKVYTYVLDTFPLKKHGYALWDFWPDRKGTFVKHCRRVENFHHPRHLMLNLLAIQRMIARSGGHMTAK